MFSKEEKEDKEREDRIRERDMEVLKSLLECDQLSDIEKEAFGGMLERMNKGNSVFWTLSESQREWAEDRYQKLELDGADKPTPLTDRQRQKAAALGPMNLEAAGPKVLSPPGRKARDG